MFSFKYLPVLIVAFLLSSAAGAQTPPGPTLQLDIPAQRMADALNEFARQSGLQVLIDWEDSREIRSPRLSGTFTPEAALQKLLAESGLRYEYLDARTISVRALKPKAGASSTGSSAIPQEAASAVRLVQVDPRAAENRPSAAAGASSSSAEESGQMTVTGTSIRGSAPVGSPVFVYTQRDFERAGASTAQQFLATLTQNFGGGRSEDTSAGGRIPGVASDRTYGGVTVNLRGLGAGSTLILVNGRRQALSGAAEYVDISLIPLTAVERIEVLPDGASAIYGSDAIGGVVNFIMRKDYTGYQTRLRAGTTTQGGGTEYQVGQGVGFGWNSGNALLNYEFHKVDPIKDDQRSSTRNIRGNNAYISGEKRNSVLASVGQDLFGRLHVSADGMYSRRTGAHFFLLPGEAEETADADNTQLGANAALSWRFNDAWSVDLGAGTNSNEVDTLQDDIFNAVSSRFESEYRLRNADLQLNGRLFSLPGGPVKLALGGGYRKEDYEITTTSIGSPPSFRRVGDFGARNAFIELMVPAAPRLAFSLAGRYEDYDSFGDSFDPKIGMQWSPVERVKLRASYGTSFRAPSVQQLEALTGNYFLQTTSGQRIVSKLGNAASLGPETSASWTAGVDFKLGGADGFDLKFTWFETDYEDRIASIPAPIAQILSDPAFAPIRVRRGDIPDAEFNALIARALSGADYRVISGCPAIYRVGFTCNEPVTNFTVFLDRGLRNLAATRDSGIDVTLGRQWNAFDVELNATYLYAYWRRITDTSPAAQLLDTTYNPADLRVRMMLSWTGENWSVAGAANYTDGYRNTAVTPNPAVKSWTTADLNLRYEPKAATGMLRNASFILSVLDVFDTDPPFVNIGIADSITYDAANADPYGRRVSLTVTKGW